MTNLIKLFLIITLLGGALVVLAEESPSVDVSAQELGISEPNILPDNPFYFFKEWGRTLQGFFVFDPLKKAELKERFASEKLLEIKKMVEQNKNKERIEKAIRLYQQEIGEVERIAQKIRERTEENVRVGEFLDKFIRQQTLHQKILQKLEEQVPAETLEKIKEAREQHLEKFGQVMQKLEENKEQIQERLEKNMEEKNVSTKEIMIQVRDKVMEKMRQGETKGNAPEACITLWGPVCGEDGKTYSNECFAKKAGVEIEHEGICVSKVSCETNDDCACGRDTETGECAFGNKKYIDESNPCPDFCASISGELKIRCVKNKCQQTGQ